MPKKACAITPGKRIERMNKLVKEYISNIPEAKDKKVLALRVLRNKLLAEDPGKAAILDETVRRQFGINIAVPYLDMKRKLDLGKAPQSIKQFDITGWVETIDDTNIKVDIDDAAGEQSFMLNVKYSGMKLGEGGSDTFSPFFFAAVNRTLSESEMAVIGKKARNYNKFDEYYDWIKNVYKFSNFKDSKVQSKARKRNLKRYWLGNQPENKTDSEDLIRFLYTNLNPDAIINDEQDVINARQPSPTFIPKPNINLKNKTKEPDFLIGSFMENNKRTVRGKKVGDVTQSFSISQMGIVKEWKAENTYFFKDKNLDITSKSIEQYEVYLGNKISKGKVLTIVGMTSGTNGEIFTTVVQPAHVNEIFPKEMIIQVLRNGNFPAETIQWAENWKGTAISMVDSLYNKIESRKTRLKSGKKALAEGDALKLSTLNHALYSIKAVGLHNLTEYLAKQVQEKNMTETMANKFYKSAANDNPYSSEGDETLSFMRFIPSMVASHEWWQAHKGDNYLMGKKADNAFNMFDRLRINASKGVVTKEVGETKEIYYNKEEVSYWYQGELFKHLIDVPGIRGLVNRMDGATFISSSYAERKGIALGNEPVYEDEYSLKQLKNAISHVAEENGKSIGYIEKKHAEHLAIPGLEIRKKIKKGQGNLIAKIVLEAGDVVIFDGNNNELDKLSDNDAVKTATGIYDLKGRSHINITLPESSDRSIIVPHTKATTNSTSPVQYLSSLNMELPGIKGKQLNKFREAMLEMMTEQSDIYIELINKASSDRHLAWALVKHMFNEKADIKHQLKQLLSMTNGAGIFQPDNMVQLKPRLLNMLLRRGVLQGRTFDSELLGDETIRNAIESIKGAIPGSSIVMKPGRDVSDGNVIISSDIAVIFDDIFKRYVDTLGEFTNKEIKEAADVMRKEPELLNEWIKNNPQSVMSFRFPIIGIQAIEMRDIQAFVPNEGDAVYHSPTDVAARLMGDTDWDHANVIIPKDKHRKIFKEFYDTQFFQSQKENIHDIGIFKESKEGNSIIARSEMRQVMVDVINGMNSQALATNLRTVASALSLKFGNIKLTTENGANPVVVRPYKLTDMVVMDYAELHNWVSEEHIPSYASIVEEDGKRYLKTTFDHASGIIVNAAVDNIKTGKLTNIFGARSFYWFLEKVFKPVSGELTDIHLEALRKLYGEYNHSSLKKLRTKKAGRKMDFGSAYYFMGLLHDNLNDTLENKKARLKDIVQSEGTIGGQKTKIVLANIDMNDNITAEERFITRAYESYINAFEKEQKQPFHLTLSTLKMIHHLAKNKMLSHLFQSNKLSKSQIKAGSDLAALFDTEYTAGIKEILQTDKEQENAMISMKPEYNKDLFDIVAKYVREINKMVAKHGVEAHKVFTFRLVYGFAEKKNVRQIPPADVLNPDIITKYMQLWDGEFDKLDQQTLEFTKEQLQVLDLAAVSKEVSTDSLIRKACKDG